MQLAPCSLPFVQSGRAEASGNYPTAARAHGKIAGTVDGVSAAC